MKLSPGVLWMEVDGYGVLHYKRNVPLNSTDIWELLDFKLIITYMISVL